jgi:hypothetical protein
MRIRLALMTLACFVVDTFPALARGGGYVSNTRYTFLEFVGLIVGFWFLYWAVIGLWYALGGLLGAGFNGIACVIDQRATLKKYATRAWRWPAS